MPRELNAAEVTAFRAAHPDIDRIILGHGTYADFNRIPEHGLAVQDGNRYVLVWQDAMNRWRFIDLTGATQLDELIQNKPAFVSPDGSFVDNLWDQLNRVGAGAETALKLLTFAVGVVVVVFVIIELQKVTA